MNQGISPAGILRERNALTKRLIQRPYSCITYLHRAGCHAELGYPDLAVGDAYRALLLLDEAQDESGEYYEESLESFFDEIGIGGKYNIVKSADLSKASKCIPESTNLHAQLVRSLGEQRLGCLAQLSQYLFQCGCLRSAYDFVNRGLEADPGNSTFLNLRREILQTYNASLLEKDPNWNDWSYDPKTELPEQGFARRELYPWNDHEPDRFSADSLHFLNGKLKEIAPKCEVRATSLPVLVKDPTFEHSSGPPATSMQLGIFAKEDIAPHEVFLQEKSLLTANNRLHDPLCDTCSAPLPPISATEPPLPTCSDCEDIVFCSPACHDAAMTLFHPAVCGKPDLEAFAKDPSPLAATNALYLHLLGRTFALSETQNIHLLDLPETKYLWGDFDVTPPLSNSTDENDDIPRPAAAAARNNKALPFTFEDSILAPIHLLTKMDIDIFASLPRTDTWVLQTLFAKFRGVASARMNERTGMPE
ncbi:MAG: hypothetical protein Q9222_003840, partial [Ikaeria aurantiellina]